MHLVDPEHGIPGSTAIVGGSIPLAVGAALSARMQGNGSIAVAFFGDGAAEEGSFHESLNFAALHRLPVLFVCENNQYATNSPFSARQPEVGIAAKGAGYGIPAATLDGNDVIAVYQGAGEAIARARSGNGPTLLECATWRWKGHVGPECDVGKGCRPSDLHAAWLSRCPLEQFHTLLRETHLVQQTLLDATEELIAREVTAAFDRARSDASPAPSTLLDHLDGRG